MMHKTNPEIINISDAIDRTPSSLAMKLCNFASLDPEEKKRGVKGLSRSSKNDKLIWNEFHSNWNQLAIESQEATDRIVRNETLHGRDNTEEVVQPAGPSERNALSKVRIFQRFFRSTVLASYNYSCAICSIPFPELLVASHIIPWSVDEDLRADPRNGIALCSIHDKAFDLGFISFTSSHKIKVSERLKIQEAPILLRVALLEIEGRVLRRPDRYLPLEKSLKFHRSKIFQA